MNRPCFLPGPGRCCPGRCGKPSLEYPFELAAMGGAPNLTGQTRGQAAMALPQAEPGLSGQPDQFAPCRLKQPGTRWMGNVLFHHRGIHGDPLEVAALHCMHPTASRLQSSRSTTTRHLPRRPDFASGSGRTGQSADGVERISPRRNAASTGSPPSGPRRPRVTSAKAC